MRGVLKGTRLLWAAISFASWSRCPTCKVELQHPLLEDLMEPVRALRLEVERLATMRLEFEKKGPDPADDSGQTATEMAMNKYNYYVCFKCTKPYYGGERACGAGGAAADAFDPSELVCAVS
jgi:E3 ubiquitin-protein ligase MYCBP2